LKYNKVKLLNRMKLTFNFGQQCLSFEGKATWSIKMTAKKSTVFAEMSFSALID